MLYIAYYVARQQKGLNKSFALIRKPASEDRLQKKIIEAFLNSKKPGLEAKTFYDTFDSRKTAKWPELLRAITECKQTGATLVIAELGTLHKSESFSEALLSSGIPFHCCDQPKVNSAALSILSQNAQVEKKLHGRLIREGLKMTSAKSGNPNAARVIGEVNKPKIHTAIVFAFVLQLILNDYIANGYSQRDMVKHLNDEGFTAPEGGTWVLSQFQKVLERVRLNKVATTLQSALRELTNDNLNAQEIANHFNANNVASLKRSAWDEQQVKKLQERIQQIQDILLLNQFVLSLLPLLHDYQKHDVPFVRILTECLDTGITIRSMAYSSSHSEHKEEVLIPPHRRVLLEQLKRDVMAFPEDSCSLASALESTIKHLPAYLTIIKSHIEQLAKVLQLENHHHQVLSQATLAEPVNQLIRIFQELKEADFQTLEGLFFAAMNWETETVETSPEVQTETEV